MPAAQPIEAVSLAEPLAGHEGVDPNHASRIRIQALLDQHASLIQQTQFADAKAGGLVTVMGLLALNGPVPMDAMMSQDRLAMAAGVLAALCILLCVFAIFPRYPGIRQRRELAKTDRYSWPALTTDRFDGEAYAVFMHTAEVSQIVHSIAHSNTAVARILLRKYQMLRIAFLVGGLDFILILVRHGGLM